MAVKFTIKLKRDKRKLGRIPLPKKPTMTIKSKKDYDRKREKEVNLEH